MMWTRFELKERGKAAFQRNYWRSVLVAFILMLFVSGGGSAVSNSWNQITSSGTSDDSYYTEYFDDGDLGHFYYNSGTSIPGMLVSGIIAVVVGGVMIVSALLGIFLFNPLEVGGCRFFMENSEYQPTVGRLGFAFQKGMYGKTVLTLFLRKLFIGLWSLLLIVPGIVKAYEYRMVPYLLADDPNMTRQDAFRLSKELMYGQKWNTFVLDLSFLGWSLLSLCTCGLLAIFYVNPYVQATNAELFLELKREYFASRQNAYPSMYRKYNSAMKITLLTVGKIKEKFLRDAIAEYSKRLSKYCKLEIIEVSDEKTPDHASEVVEKSIRDKEGERLMRYIRDDDYVITLEIGGKMLDSVAFSRQLENLGIRGQSHICFVIGGSIGLGDALVKRSDYALSFSKMTFPHQLMRVILLEQIYRSYRIMTNQPYHK